MTAPASLLEACDISAFGIGPLSITLAVGERVVIMGASGAGKSLLLRQLAELDPGEGRVSLRGMGRDAMSASSWRRRVMLVPAQSGWWASTGEEHFDRSTRDVAAAMATRLGLSPDVFRREIRVLSTGERQRLALVRALVRQPDVLLLDEPTSGLDPESVTATEALLLERSATGLGIVMVTHDRTQAQRMANRSFVMTSGRLAQV